MNHDTHSQPLVPAQHTETPAHLNGALAGAVGHAASKAATAAQPAPVNGTINTAQPMQDVVFADDALQGHHQLQVIRESDMQATAEQQPTSQLQVQQDHKQQQQSADPTTSDALQGQQAHVAGAQLCQPLALSQQTPQGGCGLPPLPPGVVQQQHQASQQHRQQQPASLGIDAAAAVSTAGRGTLRPAVAAAGAEGPRDAAAPAAQQSTGAGGTGGDAPAAFKSIVRMCHVLGDNGRINIGGGISFKIPMWYDDLAKTGLVPR